VFRFLASTMLLIVCTSVAANVWVSPIDTKYTNRSPDLFAQFDSARSVMDGYRGDSSDLNYAGSTLQKILQEDPEFAPAYREFARLYISAAHISYGNYRVQELEVAEWSLNRAIELEPNYADAYVLMGHLYTNMKRYEEAKVALDKAESIGTEIPWLRLNKAKLFGLLGQYPEALALYKRTVSEGTSSRKAYIAALEGLTSVSISLGQIEDANTGYIQAIEFAPESAWNWGNYASFLLFYYQDVDGAIRNGRKALSIMNYGAARFTLASSLYTKWSALKAEGRLEEAQKYWDEAYALHSDTSRIEQKLIGFPHLRSVAIDLSIEGFDENQFGTLLPDGTVTYDSVSTD